MFTNFRIAVSSFSSCYVLNPSCSTHRNTASGKWKAQPLSTASWQVTLRSFITASSKSTRNVCPLRAQNTSSRPLVLGTEEFVFLNWGHRPTVHILWELFLDTLVCSDGRELAYTGADDAGWVVIVRQSTSASPSRFPSGWRSLWISSGLTKPSQNTIREDDSQIVWCCHASTNPFGVHLTLQCITQMSSLENYVHMWGLHCFACGGASRVDLSG